MKSDKEKAIICPKCEKFLTKAKADDVTWHKLKHRRCNKWIWFVPATDQFIVKDVPVRKTSSGKRFF